MALNGPAPSPKAVLLVQGSLGCSCYAAKRLGLQALTLLCVTGVKCAGPSASAVQHRLKGVERRHCVSK